MCLFFVYFIREMLQKGSSKPWPDILEPFAGTRSMDASAILEYFEPLYNWLLKINKESGAHIGWTNSYSKGLHSEIQKFLVQ